MRTRFFLALAPLLAAGCAVLPRSQPAYSIEQLMAADVRNGLYFSPDGGKLLSASKASGVANAVALPLDGSPPTVLTRSAETVDLAGYFPRDERVLYLADVGGNELLHLYVRELDGSVRDLTPGTKIKAGFAGWAADGASFFATTNERDPRFMDLYEYRVDGYARTRLFENDRGYRYFAVSADRRYVAFSRVVDNAHMATYVLDRRTGRRTRVTGEGGSPPSAVNLFAPHEPVLYYSSDQGHEFRYLMRLDLATGARREAVKLDWDIAAARFSKDGRYLILSVVEDARLRPYLFDAATLARVDLGELPEGTIEPDNLDLAGDQLAFIVENGQIAGDVHVRKLGGGAEKILARGLPEGIEGEHLVAGEVIRFASYDGRRIPGILYKPHQAKSGARLPAMIWVHGGPGGEYQITFDPMSQYLVNHGYVVYAINNRGSSGSGKTFYHLDDRKHGSADLDDVVAAKKMLVDLGYVDGERIGIMGGSYGGYMTLAGLTFRSNEFAVGVDLYGVSNWPRLLRLTPAWWVDLRRYLFSEVGDPDQDEAYLNSISPLFHADKIVKPLMVLQGANDPRVTQAESDDIVKTVRAKGVPVEYLIFPDEGHGFRKKANQLKAYEGIKNFLDKYLRGPAAAAP